MSEKVKVMSQEEFASAVVAHMASRPFADFRLLTNIVDTEDRPIRPDIAPNAPWIATRGQHYGDDVWIVQYLYPLEFLFSD